MLGLTFNDKADYDKFQEDDVINFLDLDQFAPGKQLSLELLHSDGTKDVVLTNHTYNTQQIAWYKAGSALNLIAAEALRNA